MASASASRDQPGPSTGKPQGVNPVATEPFNRVNRNNGISFYAENAIPIRDYVKAFAETTPAKSIISASRISNQRIAIYLKSRETVINAVDNGFTFRGAFISVSPLVLPTTRITLSNVYTEIPNSLLVIHI